LLILALPWTDPAGFALAAILLAQHWWRHKRNPARANTP
jgi:hypothetical protein